MISSRPPMHHLASMALAIMKSQGDYSTDGPFWQKTYRDEKIKLVSGLAYKDSSNFTVTYIAILIKLPDKNVLPSDFGLPRKTENETLVFYCSEPFVFANFYRTGKWEIYLKNIHERIKAEVDKAGTLNNTPIDDILFPEQ